MPLVAGKARGLNAPVSGPHVALGPVSKCSRVLSRRSRTQTPPRNSIRCGAEDQSDDKAAGDSFAQTKRYQGNYQLAESTSLFAAALMLAYGRGFMGTLIPSDPSYPSFALASGAAALRVAGAFTFLQAIVCNSLADASVKGNLTKSTTYKRLNTAVLLNAVFVITLVGSTYAVADHMENYLLGGLMALASVPTLRATLPGLRAQGLLDSDKLWKTLGADIDALADEAGQITDTSKGWIPVYYRAQMFLSLAVGVALVLLPAVIVESPEPTFTAETLMRRVSGAEAGVLLATVNWVLLDAAKRDRLRASTFTLLNVGACFCTLAVGAILATLLKECDAVAGIPAVALLIVPTAGVYGFVASRPKPKSA